MNREKIAAQVQALGRTLGRGPGGRGQANVHPF
jgi:hypothetical protein